MKLIVGCLALLSLFALETKAQCPQVFDFYGVASSSPYWYSCTGSSFSFNLQSPDNWGPYTINWGDGTPLESGDSWISPQIINHVYAATVDTFMVEITETSTGCYLSGIVVMEQATSASIQIPVGGLTQACAPQVMEFINSSTNVSETTIFRWDFGDGTEPLTFDHTNWLQTISHLYDVGTVDCETQVQLTAENYCNRIQGGNSTATFNPIRIWDLDDAAITASATLLCYPDTTVTFMNTTERNCFFQGNIYQRYEYWNLGDYWNLGYDSIVDWTPWPPTFPKTIHFPGVGSYTISMLDSNYCGIAPASITIQIVPPPVAGIDADRDTVCLGESITFYQLATGGANSYQWNFGDGSGWIPTGSGNISYTYASPGEYIVQSRVAVMGSSSSCSDVAEMRVVVLRRPDLEIMVDDDRGCDSLDVNYSYLSNGAIAWEWTFDTEPYIYTGEFPPTIHYTNPGPHDAYLTIVGENGCTSTDDVRVRVFRSPIADFETYNVCQGDTTAFFDLSTSTTSNPIINWAWNFGDGSSTSNQQNPEHLYGAIGAYDVHLIVANSHCSDTVVKTVNIQAATDALIGANITSGCSPLNVQFTNSTANAISYYWTFGDGGFSTDSIPSHIFYNTGNQDTTYRVIMSATNALGCGGRDTLYITVHPGAIAAYTDNTNPPGCSPFAAVFTNASQNASSYHWDFGDGNTATTTNATHTYINTTGMLATYTVQLIAYSPTGCNDTVSRPVLVFPLPNFDFTIPAANGCSPLTVTMPFVQGVQNFEWDFGDGTNSVFPIPTHTYTNAGTAPVTYTVTLIGTSPFGCRDTSSANVIVSPGPLAQFTADVVSGCSPLTVQLNNQSINTSDYQWSYGDGSTSMESAAQHSHVFTNNTSGVVTYNITLTAASGGNCVSTFNIPVQVFPAVNASFEDPGPRCSPASIYFDNTSTNADSYAWDFGNGMQSVEENPTMTLQNNGNVAVQYNVGLFAYNTYGCQSLFNLPITIQPTPDANFTTSQNIACAPAPVVITNNSTPGASYFWNFGDGTTGSNSDPSFVHTFQAPNSGELSFPIQLTVTNSAGCTDTTSRTFTLYPSVSASFATGPGGCSPYPAAFVNTSQGADSYEWTFGDGQYSTENNPEHIYTTGNINDLEMEVRLIAENAFGCRDTAFATINVYHTPIAIAQLDTSFGCYPRTVTFYNGSVGADHYTWVYGTGITSDTTALYHDVTYYNFGETVITYPVTLNAYTEHGCSAQDQLSVEVAPRVEANFSFNAAGCSPLQVDFNNQSDGALAYFWNFGDGDVSSESEPTHTFFNWGNTDTTYQVTLHITNAYGCSDSTDASVTVLTRPIAAFVATPEEQVWPSATVSIDNNSQGGSVNYEWNMGDGTVQYTATPADYTYSNWGDYTIRLIISNGFCSDTAFQQISITAPPAVANFDIAASGCAPLTVQFTNSSQFAIFSNWQFGDGGTANATNPVYTYWQPGTYTVTLTVTGADGSTDQMVLEQVIHVYPSAQAVFTVTPNQVNIPTQPVYCINLSQSANSYTWLFGDGETSNEVNPLHYYQSEGVWDVMLIANNDYNCPDTMLVVGAVTSKAGGMIDFPNAFTPRPDGGNGGGYNELDFSNDIFFPMHAGVDEYSLQIFNKWGELLFESKDVNKGWDGYYRGQLCKQDVYVWRVRARFVDGQTYEKAGDVTLLVKN